MKSRLPGRLDFKDVRQRALATSRGRLLLLSYALLGLVLAAVIIWSRYYSLWLPVVVMTLGWIAVTVIINTTTPRGHSKIGSRLR